MYRRLIPGFLPPGPYGSGQAGVHLQGEGIEPGEIAFSPVVMLPCRPYEAAVVPKQSFFAACGTRQSSEG